MSKGFARVPRLPTWRLEWDSNMLPSGWKTPSLPLSHHAPRVSVCVSFCVSVCMSVCMSVGKSVCVCLYVCVYACGLICMSVSVSVCVYLCICLRVCLNVSVCLCVYLCLSACILYNPILCQSSSLFSFTRSVQPNPDVCLSLSRSVCPLPCLSVYISFLISSSVTLITSVLAKAESKGNPLAVSPIPNRFLGKWIDTASLPSFERPN